MGSKANKPSMKDWAVIFIESSLFVIAIVSLQYSAQFFRTWFTNFTDQCELVISAVLLTFSLAIPIIYIRMRNKRLEEKEKKIDFPNEIKVGDIPKWRPIVRRIKKKMVDPLYLVLLAAPIFYLSVAFVLLSQIAFFYAAQNHYLDFLLQLHGAALVASVFVLYSLVVIVISFLPLAMVTLGTAFLMRKYLEYPTEADAIFAHSFSISEKLSNNDRLSAQREVPQFLGSLTAFHRNWRFNPRRKVYAEEFAILRRNRTAICRMLMFSQDYMSEHIAGLFMGFGLALRREDDPTAFKHLKNLIAGSQEFTKPSDKVKNFLNKIERYPTATNLLAALVFAVIAVLFFILGYPELATLIRGG
jgi:hypothetical protein